jgi:acyl phosphate:glycerol-3-phosphate acyltransferase
MIVLVIILVFFIGAIPFSVWLGRFFLRQDVRNFGDGNPGTTNVFRAGGKRLGILVALLDGSKGGLPVLLGMWVFHLPPWELFALAIAPTLGHAFSPFLRFKGGKAVAATFGMWVGLTLYEAPIVLGIMLFYWFKFITVSGWAMMLALLSLGLYLLLARPEPLLLGVWLTNTLILAWKHRTDLQQPLALRPRKNQRTA